MTFQRWAKELLMKEMDCEGQITYNRENGWCCLTATGFLLRAKFEKIRFGNFRLNYEIMPLVGGIGKTPTGTLTAYERDAKIDYDNIRGLSMDERRLNSLETAAFESPKTYESAAEIIHDFLNPLFQSLQSYREYCINCIYMLMLWKNVGTQESDRRKLAADYFDNRLPVDRALKDPNYPSYYPSHTVLTTSMRYVYAAMDKYQEALDEIRGIKDKIVDVIRMNYKWGYITKGDMVSDIQEAMQENADLEQAMVENDHTQCMEILNRNYQKNRILIKETLGFDLPSSIDFL